MTLPDTLQHVPLPPLKIYDSLSLIIDPCMSTASYQHPHPGRKWNSSSPPPGTTIANSSSARVKPQESFLGPSMLYFCLAWPHESNHGAMSLWRKQPCLVQKTFHVIPPHLLALILFPVPTPRCSLNLVEVVTVTYTVSAFWPVMLLCIDHCPPTLAKILQLVASGRRGVNFLYECSPWWVIYHPVKAAHLRVYEQHKLKSLKTKTGYSLVGLESWNGSGRSGERGQIWPKYNVWNS